MPDVVIVGGGVVGIATSYYLGKAGVRATVIEKDAIAAHASGFAYGGLGPLSGAGIPGPMAELAQESFQLHKDMAGACRRSPALTTNTRAGHRFRLRSMMSRPPESRQGPTGRTGRTVSAPNGWTRTGCARSIPGFRPMRSAGASARVGGSGAVQVRARAGAGRREAGRRGAARRRHRPGA